MAASDRTPRTRVSSPTRTTIRNGNVPGQTSPEPTTPRPTGSAAPTASVGPVPPGARRPPARPGRRGRPVGSYLLVAAGILLVLLSGGIYFGVHTAITKVTTSIPTANLLGRQGATATSINGVINILLIGVDTRPNNTIGSRSDSIIILHIPASHETGYLVSIPRDSRVNVPGHGLAKINSAFMDGSAHGGGYAGGGQMLAKTLRADFGLTFNAAMIVNFHGFENIVKALGGVTMYVDEDTKSLHHGYRIVNGRRIIAKPYVTYDKGGHWSAVPGVTPVIYRKGTQRLSAYEALDYVRIRDFLPHGDYDRERHQQQFIKAVLQEAVQKGLSNPLTASTFLDSISKAFVWDGGNQPMSNWIFTMKAFSPASLTTIKTNAGTFNSRMIGGQSYEILSPASLRLLHDIRDNQLDAFIQAHPSWVATDQ